MDSARKEQIFAEIFEFYREKIIQCFWISEKKYSTKKGSDSSKDCKKIKKKEHPAFCGMLCLLSKMKRILFSCTRVTRNHRKANTFLLVLSTE